MRYFFSFRVLCLLEKKQGLLLKDFSFSTLTRLFIYNKSHGEKKILVPNSCTYNHSPKAELGKEGEIGRLLFIMNGRGKQL